MSTSPGASQATSELGDAALAADNRATSSAVTATRKERQQLPQAVQRNVVGETAVGETTMVAIVSPASGERKSQLSDGRRLAGRGLGHGLAYGRLQHAHALRARHRELAVEDEKRHAADATLGGRYGGFAR